MRRHLERDASIKMANSSYVNKCLSNDYSKKLLNPLKFIAFNSFMQGISIIKSNEFTSYLKNYIPVTAVDQVFAVNEFRKE